MQPIDPERLMFLMEAASTTQEQIRQFKEVSEMLIEVGKVQRLDEKAALQAIDRLAFEIVKMSFGMACAVHLTAEEACAIPAVEQELAKMDEIMLTIAFGSGIHKAIVDVLISERCDYHTQQYLDKLPLLKK